MASGQTGFPQHPRQQLFGEFRQQSGWLESKLNNNQSLLSRWHHKKKKERQQSHTLRTETLQQTRMTSEVTCSFLDSNLHSAQAFAWQQTPAARLLIQNQYKIVFVRSLHKEESFLRGQRHRCSDRALGNCDGESRFWRTWV